MKDNGGTLKRLVAVNENARYAQKKGKNNVTNERNVVFFTHFSLVYNRISLSLHHH